MRELIFRGLNENNEEYVGNLIIKEVPKFSGFFESTVKTAQIQLEGLDDIESVIPQTVSQYTGVKDSNGNMIFENDIVEFYDNDTDRLMCVAVIIWSNKKYQFCVVNVESGDSSSLARVKEFKAVRVGNAFSIECDKHKSRFNREVAKKIMAEEY